MVLGALSYSSDRRKQPLIDAFLGGLNRIAPRRVLWSVKDAQRKQLLPQSLSKHIMTVCILV